MSPRGSRDNYRPAEPATDLTTPRELSSKRLAGIKAACEEAIRTEGECPVKNPQLIVMLVERIEAEQAEVKRQHEGWTDANAQLDDTARAYERLRAALKELLRIEASYHDARGNCVRDIARAALEAVKPCACGAVGEHDCPGGNLVLEATESPLRGGKE